MFPARREARGGGSVFNAASIPASSHSRDRFELILRRVLWIGILVLLLFSIGEMIFFFFISPNTFVQKIDIKSDLAIPNDEVVALAGISRNEYYFSINTQMIEERLKTHPMVKEAVVEKAFPDTIKVTLIGRTPLLVSYTAAGGKTTPVVFDDEGILFELGDKLSERNIPVLSGVKLKETAQGAALPKILRPFLKDLGELKRKNNELYNLISEIRVVSTSNGGYELILYPLSYPIKVWIGKRINAGMMRYMFFGLHFMEQEGIMKKIDEADFRTGELVYRMKGEQ
jgi:cell division protein FtsQ